MMMTTRNARRALRRQEAHLVSLETRRSVAARDVAALNVGLILARQLVNTLELAEPSDLTPQGVVESVSRNCGFRWLKRWRPRSADPVRAARGAFWTIETAIGQAEIALAEKTDEVDRAQLAFAEAANSIVRANPVIAGPFAALATLAGIDFAEETAVSTLAHFRAWISGRGEASAQLAGAKL